MNGRKGRGHPVGVHPVRPFLDTGRASGLPARARYTASRRDDYFFRTWTSSTIEKFARSKWTLVTFSLWTALVA